MVFGNMDVDIPCPACKQTFKMKLRQIQNGKEVTCPNCRKVITLKVEGDDLSKPDKELDKLSKSIKDIKLDIKIDL